MYSAGEIRTIETLSGGVVFLRDAVLRPELEGEDSTVTVEQLGADYREYRRIVDGGRTDESAGTVTTTMPGEELLSGINSSMHVLDANDRLLLYGLVPDHMLTEHSARMRRIGELWKFFKNLKPADFAKHQGLIRPAAMELVALSRRIAKVYTEDNLLPNFAMSRLMRAAYDGEDITSVRFDWDISRLNAVDETGTLADEFIPEVGDWLREKVIKHPDVHSLFDGDLPVAIRLPERSSFALFGSNSERGARLVKFLIGQLGRFQEDMQAKLSESRDSGWISPDVDISEFTPRATIHHTTIRLKSFMHGYVEEHGLESINEVPVHVVVDHILSELRRLAGQTTYLKAHSPADAIRIGGLFVYGEDALPIPDPASVAYQTLEFYVNNGRGFVPFGRYGYQDEHVDEIRAILEHPEVAHNMKGLSSSRTSEGGGAVEHFWYWISTFLANPDVAKGYQVFAPFRHEV